VFFASIATSTVEKEHEKSDTTCRDDQEEEMKEVIAAAPIRPRVADRYELFTGHKSARNLYSYQKLGYREFKRIPVMTQLYLCSWRNIGIIIKR
jgi:hypothetical protein